MLRFVSKRRLPRLAACLLIAAIIYTTYHSSSQTTRQLSQQDYIYTSFDRRHESQYAFACGNVPEMEHVFVVMKTGASEAQSKLPVHFDTTFKCATQYAIFSDVEEVINGHRIYDALESISPETRSRHPEFELYDKIRAYKQAGRKDYHQLLDLRDVPKEENPAWKLDRWKFLPMLEKAAQLKPSARWYVFMEADTNFVWSNLYHWLEGRDWTRPQYFGGSWLANGTQFAHGGTGFIISAETLHRVVRYKRENPRLIDNLVGDECCGDLALGKVLGQLNVSLVETFPMLQADNLVTVENSGLNWCFPVLSHHHMAPEAIRDLWNFQRAVFESDRFGTPRREHRTQPLTHRDIFEHYSGPWMTSSERVGWDNMSNEDVGAGLDGEEDVDEEQEAEVHSGDQKPKLVRDDIVLARRIAGSSAQQCRQLCSFDEECYQWTYHPGTCRTSKIFRLGEKVEDQARAKDIRSGWMLDRINKFRTEWSACDITWSEDSR